MGIPCISRAGYAGITIILVRPRIPENIGACCRAMKNMGLSRLKVVAPEAWDPVRIMKTATHACRDVVEKIEICGDTATAVSPFSYIAGTTARMGRQRQMVLSPGGFAEKAVTLCRENPVAVMFGPEDRGLENDDLQYCHNLVHIPTSEFSSLNLAQAVLVICYELFGAARPPDQDHFSPRLASSFELEGMYDQMKEVLLAIDFLRPDNPDYWMNNFRRFASRVGLTAKEVKLIRGVCRQVNWYGEKRYADGRAEKKKKDPR
ncbi:MAG: RNA methyltransferase [Thermodesulfobacteriota bacterium]|nr:RNA methyltransferase [Thermodesulfobacteriota bacterium]